MAIGASLFMSRTRHSCYDRTMESICLALVKMFQLISNQVEIPTHCVDHADAGTFYGGNPILFGPASESELRQILSEHET